MTEREFVSCYYPYIRAKEVMQSLLCEVFGHDRETLETWAGKADGG